MNENLYVSNPGIEQNSISNITDCMPDPSIFNSRLRPYKRLDNRLPLVFIFQVCIPVQSASYRRCRKRRTYNPDWKSDYRNRKQIKRKCVRRRRAKSSWRRRRANSRSKLKGNEPFQVFVLSYKTMTIDVSKTTTIEQLKERVSLKMDLPVEKFYLTFGGKRLMDSYELGEYDIHAHANIWVIRYINGGTLEGQGESQMDVSQKRKRKQKNPPPTLTDSQKKSKK